MSKNIYRYLVCLSLFFTCFLSFAQKDKLKEADKMFDRYAFIDAREIYLEVAEAGYKSESLFEKLGDSYYFNGDLPNALKWYQELYDLKQTDLEKEYLFRYAMALKSDQQYKKSDEVLLEFEKLNETDSRLELLKGERNYLELIELQSGKFDIEIAPINSKLSDFSPHISNNTLIFASNRETPSSVKRIHKWNNQPYLDLYTVSLNEENKIEGEPVLMSEVINSKFHESSACLTKDQLSIYFTRNNYNNKKYGKSEEGVNFLKIYKSERESLDAAWKTPVELPFNSDEYSVAHPTLNAEETKLYFSSDMPGTLGMSDIYVVSIHKDGTYGKTENVGDRINTEGPETFPFLNQQEELYFSSDGHIGLGGLDVFVSVLKEDGTFGEVFNVGRPINSSKDDFNFELGRDNRRGFFTTNREGGVGEDDIYYFAQKEDLITSCQQYITGVITESGTQTPLAGVNVELFDENLNFLKDTETNEKGEYEFTLDCETRYIIRVSKEGYITTEELLKSGAEFEKNIQIPAVSMKKGEELGITKAGKGDDLRKLLQLDPIYFDLDKSNIRKAAEVELQKVLAVLRKYSKMKIDIRSHTDSRAGDAYNLLLSEKRAQSTFNYLLQKGIDKSRITAKGYGETQLINDCDNNTDCSEEEHQMNRRSEFIILNENETPQEMRKGIAVRSSENVDTKRHTSEKMMTTDAYDFDSPNPKEIFTVQVVAGSSNNPVVKYKSLSSVYHYSYADGLRRYFSAQFKTRAQADAYKLELRNKGFDGAFVVGLRGKERF
ncbi:OmpA family protein [Mesonia ostreae]|uniref:OmpA family protein n=1 Tax=Mesonia ostreae TaxID=861110 RepID=A0ABU2KMC1_9FLAO|nr:OmpA family protein [Mesonia ostreae]MDT0295808.1 OmpA family protein [Mesonia ostreae]